MGFFTPSGNGVLKNAGNTAEQVTGNDQSRQGDAYKLGLGSLQGAGQKGYLSSLYNPNGPAAGQLPFLRGLYGVKPGALSPSAQAAYQRDVENSGQQYSASLAGGLRGLAARGMGGAPTGAASSIENTAARSRDMNNVESYRQAQQNTVGQGIAGIQASTVPINTGLSGVRGLQDNAQIYSGLQGIYDPTRALNTQVGAGQALDAEGTGLGHLGSFLGTLGGVASKFINPISFGGGGGGGTGGG